MRDILVDEKITGSFHLTPGEAYEEADNGNQSQVHWLHGKHPTPEYGGEISISTVNLIRRDVSASQLRSLNRHTHFDQIQQI
jgi:aminopeptidase